MVVKSRTWQCTLFCRMVVVYLNNQALITPTMSWYDEHFFVCLPTPARLAVPPPILCFQPRRVHPGAWTLKTFQPMLKCCPKESPSGVHQKVMIPALMVSLSHAPPIFKSTAVIMPSYSISAPVSIPSFNRCNKTREEKSLGLLAGARQMDRLIAMQIKKRRGG